MSEQVQAAPVVSLSGLPRMENGPSPVQANELGGGRSSEQTEAERAAEQKRKAKRDAMFNVSTQLTDDTAGLDPRASITEMARMDAAVQRTEKQNKADQADENQSAENIIGLASLAAGVAMHGVAEGVTHHIAEEALKEEGDQDKQHRGPSPEPEA